MYIWLNLTIFLLIDLLWRWKNKFEVEYTDQVVKGHQALQNGPNTLGFGSALRQAVLIWCTPTQQVYQGGVECQDGAPSVNIILIIFCLFFLTDEAIGKVYKLLFEYTAKPLKGIIRNVTEVEFGILQ